MAGDDKKRDRDEERRKFHEGVDEAWGAMTSTAMADFSLGLAEICVDNNAASVAAQKALHAIVTGFARKHRVQVPMGMDMETAEQVLAGILLHYEDRDDPEPEPEELPKIGDLVHG